MTREEALTFVRLSINEDLAGTEYASYEFAERAAAAYSIVLDTAYVARQRGYKFMVEPLQGLPKLTRRKP